MGSDMRMQGQLRITVVLLSCLAIVAQTSGLPLVVHLSSLAHPADHHSEDCSVCQQLCVLSKKLMLDPPIEVVADAPPRLGHAPEFIEHIQDHHPQVHHARAPPHLHQQQPA